ncbi:MAG: T9SS type A sorting domain-containing protein [Bacteroidetes bacterium]|nr:T9SS type A sorting domain-containing protein [Bacteroidota bacterium]
MAHVSYIGTSNLPDYNLGPLVGSGCDTLSLPNPSQGGALGTVSAYIHQEWQTIFVNAQNLKGQNVTMSVYDGLGSLKFEVESLKSVGGYFTQNINATNWPAGLYLIELKTEKEKIACKVVKY